MAKGRKTDRVEASTSAEAALRLLVRTGAAEFARQLRAVMRSPAIEGPHKARVALRRLRVALKAFKLLMAGRVYRDLMDRLRRMFHLIGPLRDADVLALAMGEPDLFAAATATRIKVRAALKHHDAADLAPHLTQVFKGKGWRRKGTKSARHSPVAHPAARALTDSWRACQTHGPDLMRLDPTARHDLRKHLKTLRYLCDHFRGIWPGPAHDAFFARLKSLQEELGFLNDQAVARSRGFATPDDAPTLAAAQDHWTALRASPRWWRDPGKS